MSFGYLSFWKFSFFSSLCNISLIFMCKIAYLSLTFCCKLVDFFGFSLMSFVCARFLIGVFVCAHRLYYGFDINSKRLEKCVFNCGFKPLNCAICLCFICGVLKESRSLRIMLPLYSSETFNVPSSYLKLSDL